MIDISGFDKADVLRRLYNRARAQGLGILQFDPKPMTIEEARAFLAKSTYFDYVKGRVLKVNLSGAMLDEWLYDRDNGAGAALDALTRPWRI